MDPLTQGLLGAAAAQALFSKELGRSAWVIGAAGGMLADADVFIRSEYDPLLAVEYHRQFTHSLVFIPVGGAVASIPWLLQKKYRARWKPVLGAAIAAYATHGLLDACTTYGTQLFWPFSSLRVAWDCIAIVDPLFTLVLLAGVISSAKTRKWRPAVIALAICLAYLTIGSIQRERAEAAQNKIAESRGHERSRFDAFPTLANLVVWRSLYQSGDSLFADRIRVPFFGWSEFSPGAVVAHTDVSDLPPSYTTDARILEDFRRFRWFSSGWVAQAPDQPEVYGDVRYSLRTDAFDPIWGVRFHPGSDRPTEWVDRTSDREMDLGSLWREIAGDAPLRPIPRLKTMRAVVQDRYGAPHEVLHLREIDTPTPAPDEVLVRVRAASVHADVWHVVTGYPRVLRLMGAGLRKPKQPIPGIDMAGVVEAVGREVTGFAPGDAVFGETHRQMQWVNGAAYAEYVSAPHDILARKPEGIPFEQAATVPTAGMIAVNNLRDRLWAGQRVVINGAAGGVGSFAIQMAKADGAFVVGVDHTEKLDYMRSLGADEVVDYTREDFTRRSERYDLILDVASTLSLSDCRRVLEPDGAYVIIGHDHFRKSTLGSLPHIFGLMARAPFDRHLPRPDFETMNKRDAMEILRGLLETGKLTPVVAKTFPLTEVPAALRYLQEGQLCGRIVVVP